MRHAVLTLVVAVGLVAILSCDDDISIPYGTFGIASAGNQSAVAPDGLTQFVTLTVDTTNDLSGVIISTYVTNTSSSTISAILRGCALQPSDFMETPAGSLLFTAPDQAACAGKQDTVSLPPFASSDTLTDEYYPKAVGGVTYNIGIRQILQPEFWAAVTLQFKGTAGGS